VDRKVYRLNETGIADIHTHTMYSGFSRYSYLSYPDSVTTPRTSVKVAEKLGLDVLCITDHNSIKGGIEAKKCNENLVVVGEEISSKDGEIIGLFLQEAIMPDLSAEETIELIHEQDGIAIAPHPFSAHCSCIGQKVRKLRLDGIEVFNAVHRDGYSNAIALESCNGYAKLGGSDAHASCMIGNGYTLFKGGSQEDFRNAIKHRETSYGGKVTSLWEFTNYSIKVAYESSKIILNFNGMECPMSTRIGRMRRSSKAFYFFCSFMFAFSPLPVACSLLGDRILRKKGLKVWKDCRK
jgi:predicted metal-dependent phosphoesterase TrpH